MELDLEDHVGFFGGVKVINTKVKHGRQKVVEGGNRWWAVLSRHQGMERGVSIMEVDGPLDVHRGKG